MEDDDYFESAIEYDEALKRGEEPSFSAYAARHAEHPDRKDYLRHLIKMHGDHLRYRCQSPIPSITHLCANNDGLVRELEGQLRDELEPEFLCPERVDEYAIESVEYQGPGSFVLLGDSPRVGKVAIKFAREVEDTEQWIRNEKNCLQRLSHPCIVKFDGFGSYRGRPYIATKHFEGKTLAVVSGSLEKSRVVAIIKDVARAVQYLHDRQIVHYDLGPQNIVLIEGSETPLIFDFGLSVHIDAHSNPNGYARGAHGTPGFMSPEQAAGDPNADAVRCDIFQLGALLVFGLKRQRIFIGDTDGSIIENTLRRAFNTSVLRELQREDRMLARICKRAVAENPSGRYATARELADALEDYQYRRFGKPSNIAKDWRVWAALVSAGVVVALLPKHPSNSNAKGMHAIASAPDGAMPAELADQLAACKNRSHCGSTEDLTVELSFTLHHLAMATQSKFGLRNELKPRLSIDFARVRPPAVS
ncbi:MAG: serine/threonine-protein kinase [Pirellulaceae bacterium]